MLKEAVMDETQGKMFWALSVVLIPPFYKSSPHMQTNRADFEISNEITWAWYSYGNIPSDATY